MKVLNAIYIADPQWYFVTEHEGHESQHPGDAVTHRATNHRPMNPLASTAQMLQSPFLSLPTETLLEITENLPLKSVMALSLASKDFRVILMQQALKLFPDHIAISMFLQLLLRAVRPHGLCAMCNKLFRYRREGGLEIARCPPTRITYGY